MTRALPLRFSQTPGPPQPILTPQTLPGRTTLGQQPLASSSHARRASLRDRSAAYRALGVPTSNRQPVSSFAQPVDLARVAKNRVPELSKHAILALSTKLQ